MGTPAADVTDATIEEVVTHHRSCPLCEACCGLEITTKGDQVVRIRGDMDDPYSKGFICPKGSALKQLHEDPDRLTSPRIRTDDGWKEATWDEAFAEIQRRLAPIVEAHGRQALGTVLGNPNTHNLGGQLYVRPVMTAVGSTNAFSASTVDQMPKHVSAGLMWGRPDMFPLPDLDRTDYLLMLGANPYASNGSLLTAPDMPGRLEAIRERGTFVVVDPRRTKTAENASEHLTIVPGTDAYWLMALIDTLFSEGLVDIGRLESHVSGVDEVREMTAAYTADAVAERCGIPADTTRRIARELAAAPTAAVYGRMGAHTVEFGTIASWATDVLNVLTGNLDEPGGVMFNCAPTQNMAPSTPGGRGFTLGRWSGRASGRPEVKGELPAATLAEEITAPGDGIKALFVLACNPVRSFPNSERIDEALQQLDLLVVVDPYVTATGRHAHVILPPTSALERSHYDFAFEANMIRSFAKYSPAVFETDAPSEEQILSRLALVIQGQPVDTDPVIVHDQMMEQLVDAELGRASSRIHGRDRAEILEALAPWEWSEQIIDFRLRVGQHGDAFGADPDGLTLRKLIDEHPSGADFGPLVPRFPDAIKTVSGTVELAPRPIVDDMARLGARFAEYDAQREQAGGQFVLIGRRHLKTVNSWMHNLNVLIKGRTDCTLQVHPDDAARLGLVDGGSANVRSRVGAVVAPVEVTDEVMPGVVCLPHGWGYDEPGIEMHTAKTKPGVNSNALTDDAALDDLSGNCALNGIPVEVTAA
ncbi:MAG: molybdopterin-dependent oxidoreductase [Ilumatobacter sp.]|uniref:molybdopterin-dependent oxidoreductase n=1 Tax=Ilumatobacter sp. TaxID=1967498 RepID=UPI003299017C